MIYKFSAFGHPNILAAHKTTLEFTKDEDVTSKGNCIIGVKSDFALEKIKDFIKNCKNRKIAIIIKAASKNAISSEKINAEINPNFNHDKELVIRKTDFVSERTLGIKANKAAFELEKGLIDYLKERNSKITVIIENKP